MQDSPTTGFPRNLLQETAVELGVAEAALDDAAEFFRTRAAVPPGSGILEASEDPHVILRFGQLQARLHAAQGLLARAKRVANSGATSGTLSTAADVATIEARAYATDLAAEVIAQAISWGSPLRPRDPSPAQTPEARASAPHNSSAWNYHHAGRYYLKGTGPTRSAGTEAQQP